MTLDRHQPSAVVRHRLLEATIAMVAADGVRAVSSASVTATAMLDRSAVSRYFGSCDQMLLSAATLVAKREVLPAPHTLGLDESALSVLSDLAEAHRAYVDRAPERFAAILQLSSAAVFSTPRVMPPITARTLRTRAVAEAHLAQLQAAGLVAPQTEISLIAAGFVDAMTGIEICHLIDRDTVIRNDAYGVLCSVVALRISGSRRR